MSEKQPNPNFTPPASVGCETPEYRRMTPPPAPKPAAAADEYITISVAEYHYLTKAATMLEIMVNDNTMYSSTLDSVRRTIQEMKSMEGIF